MMAALRCWAMPRMLLKSMGRVDGGVVIKFFISSVGWLRHGRYSGED